MPKKRVRIFVFHIFIISTCFALFSCNNKPNQENNDINKHKKVIKKFDLKKVDTSDSFDFKEDKNWDTVKVKGKSLIFFTKSRKEFQKMLSTGGDETKWEYDMIYNNFKKTAENSKLPLEQHNIYTIYTDKPVILFLSENNDNYIFNRKTNDYFIGQLFFNGIDSFRLEEGLIKTDDLESIISDFFDIASRIEITTVQEISDSFRYYQVDTTIVTVSDSIPE